MPQCPHGCHLFASSTWPVDTSCSLEAIVITIGYVMQRGVKSGAYSRFTIMANKFQSVFDASLLNERGNQLEFCWRQRQITPFRFGLSVVASMAAQEVQSIADLQRHFNALWDAEVSYKVFYNQLAKASCASFLLTSLSDIMGKLTMKVLGFEAGQALSACKRLVMQDGSSFALHDALSQVFPGRFNAVKPAAVELHCTMDLLQDAPLTIVLSPDTDSEHEYLPAPESLQGALFLADRGYLDLTYLRDVDRHGGFFLVRGKAGLNPRVLNAFREDGQRIKSCQDRDLQAIITDNYIDLYGHLFGISLALS